MAHIACICIPAHGHLNPMAAVARELIARGHRVTFFQVPDAEPMIRRLGLAFEPVGAATFPPGTLQDATRAAGRVTGFSGIMPMIHRFASGTAMYCRELPQAFRAHGIDMILTDQLEAAGGLVGYHLGLPFVTLAAALPLNWEVGIPSPFVGWSYGETRWHRARNVASAYVARRAMRPINDVIAQVAADWKLKLGRQIEDYSSRWAQISQLTPSLDYPRDALSRCFHYCGPLRATAPTPVSPHPPTGHAFASLGTLQGHRAALFDTIARAATADGLRLTIAHGGGLSDDEVAHLSHQAEVHGFVDQAEVLGRSDVAILHGGLNTVLDALAQGVPMVLVPVAYEQGAIASRVVRAGAGLTCRGGPFRKRRLAALIREVCGDPRYAAAAARLGDEICAAGGTPRAVDIIEQLIRTGKPVLNARPGPTKDAR